MSWICKTCRTVVNESGQEMNSTNCPVCGTVLEQEAPVRSIRVVTAKAFGRYELKECVGSGHFGNVWRAIDTKLTREVALKLPRHIGGESKDKKLFLREAQCASVLNHPGILTVFEVGEEGDCIFIVSEYVPGGTLQKQLKEYTPSIPQAVEYALQIAQALDHAHTHNVIHRDLKPGNILLTSKGLLKISDFGLAKKMTDKSGLTKEGEIFGTYDYMSPEQARAEHQLVDHRADLYSLGVILYEMLSGQRPFTAKDPDFAKKLQFTPPVSPRSLNPMVPDALSRICLKCLEKSAADRYGSAAEIVDDLRSWQSDRAADNLANTIVAPVMRPDLHSALPLSMQSGAALAPSASNPTPGRSDTDPMGMAATMPAAMRGTGNRVAPWQFVLGLLGVLGLAAGVNFGFGKQEPASASGPGPAAAVEEGAASGPDKTPNENKFPHMPKPLRVRIETEPPGAQVAVWGFHPAYGILDKDQFYPASEKSPVELELPPGDYFIVVGLEDGRFHEVLRHVPLHSGMLADGIRHRQFETKNGVVELRSIVIPDLDVTRGMADVKEANPFMMGDESSELAKHPRKMPAFWVDPHEVTYGRLKEVPMVVISYMGITEVPDPDSAAAAIKWDDALWAAELMGKRLMFESEYELVATNRGTTKFPWGNDASQLKSWKYGKTLQPGFDRVIVGEVPVDGLFSNLAEWTMTPASYYPTGLVSAIELPADEFVVRGGDLDVTQGIGPGDMSLKHGAHVRSTIYKWEMREGVGFRCARSQRPRFTIDDCEQMTIPNH